MLIWKQMVLLHIRSEFITESYKVLVILSHLPHSEKITNTNSPSDTPSYACVPGQSPQTPCRNQSLQGVFLTGSRHHEKNFWIRDLSG